MNEKKNIITPVSLRHLVTEMVGLEILAWSPTIELFYLESRDGFSPPLLGCQDYSRGFCLWGFIQSVYYIYNYNIMCIYIICNNIIYIFNNIYIYVYYNICNNIYIYMYVKYYIYICYNICRDVA